MRERLSSLEKLHPDLSKKDRLPGDRKEERVDMRVELEKTKPSQRKGLVFRAEAQFNLGKAVFRAESRKDDIREAVVEVKDDLQVQIKKFKGRARAAMERGARKMKRETKTAEGAKNEEGERVREEGK